MKNILLVLVLTSFILVSCWKVETKNEHITIEKIVSSELLLNSPYVELYESKQWKLSEGSSWTNSWSFTTNEGNAIDISYSGNWLIWWRDSLRINDVNITDMSDCLKWQNKEWQFSEDDPIFVRANCAEYYHWFTFNWATVDHDFKNSMDWIWISKSESKVALYGGKLIIDYVNKSYSLSENTIDLQNNWFILLSLVY